jgi:formate-dependent nitrite reductase membrane component NrfD
MGGESRRYYDAPSKGILWGWEVWSYVTTKAIATGAILIPVLSWTFGGVILNEQDWFNAVGTALIFLLLTTALLIKDLDQPLRFLYVILRPQWRSWLVKGGYALSFYGALLTLVFASFFLGWWKQPNLWFAGLMWLTGLAALVTAIYTAFLFAQAKGRDFWQSPLLVLHMLGHSFAAGAAALLVPASFDPEAIVWASALGAVLKVSLFLNLVLLLLELSITHSTEDAKLVVKMILKGQYRQLFWLVSIALGIFLPLVLLNLAGGELWANILAALAVLIGIFYTEKIWVEAPQRIPLS